MADAEQPKTKKKGGLGRILMITVGALTLAGAGAAGGFYAASKVSAAPGPKQAEPEKVDTHYFEVEKGFTSNLKEPDRYVEVALGVSTHGEQSAEDISTLPGKTRLQGRLRVALNDLLKAKTGKAGIDDVYFTNFIVQ